MVSGRGSLRVFEHGYIEANCQASSNATTFMSIRVFEHGYIEGHYFSVSILIPGVSIRVFEHGYIEGTRRLTRC